jgi:type II secretory ATPase GspE/PulE/Tfp pilus assembly ATPase PilB-like protein
MANPGSSADFPASPSSGKENHHPDFGHQYLNLDQMTSLVDSILPFEACLYYQVIPLSIGNSHLNLGMVNPDDTAATDYVRQQVAYINYSLVTHPILADWHRDVLSQYLSRKAKAKPRTRTDHNSPQTLSESRVSAPIHPADQATFIVDSPTELPTDSSAPRPVVKNSNTPPDQDYGRSAVKPAPSTSPVSLNRRNYPAINSDRPPHQLSGQGSQPLDLKVSPTNPAMAFEAMAKLPPQKLTQALLQRVLQDGIGRLYFERHDTTGRILWSKDGIVQAALNDLDLSVFQSVINEFKRLTHLPLLPTQETRQVEIERTYRRERVVLRFRLMANPQGEEATLQVLRGAALKFYQQQQIDQLGRDALTFAHRLQTQINQIRDRARQTFTLEGTPEATLTTISHLLKEIDTEINQLIHHQEKNS